MYVHADRGASRATKTSVRATNVKHVDTREHTDEPRQRTHRERGGERAESAGLRSLSLSPSLSFFLPSIDAASLFLRSSLCSSRWVPRWLHVLIFLYNRRVREKKTRTSLYPYVCNADASVYSRILCRHAPSLFSIHLPLRVSIVSIYLSIVLSPHMHAHRYCAPGTTKNRTKRVVLHTSMQRERERERFQRALTLVPRVFSRKSRPLEREKAEVAVARH